MTERTAAPGGLPYLTHSNWMRPEVNGRSFQRVDQLMPTSTVDRGSGPVSDLPVDEVDLRGFRFTDQYGTERTFEGYLEDGHVDALLLWQDGALRQAVYRNGQTPRTRHIVFSVTKSFTGLLAEMLVDDGLLDDSRLIPEYVHELDVPGGAYTDATLRNLLDMEIGIDFTEIYDDPQSDIRQFSYAAGMRRLQPALARFDNLYDYLPTMRKKGEHGVDFHYVTSNSEVLGWVIERVTDRPIAEYFAERVYQHIGADRDAFYITDRLGKAVAGGGLCITAPDLLRLALMVSHDGEWNGTRIVPERVMARLKADGTPRPSLWGNEGGGTDNSYTSQWYHHGPDHLLHAAGIHAQTIFISTVKDAVMVVQSSCPTADNDYFGVAQRFFTAVTAAR
ncbi:MAG: hypothetical protein RL238_3474 [Actinomycetota bacterium]